MKNKFKKLQSYLRSLEKEGVCLAFSGGIDSALLLYLLNLRAKLKNREKTAAKNSKTFDAQGFMAVTFKSEFQTEEEIEFTKEFCKKFDVSQKVIEFSVLGNTKIKNNPKDRCYHCKKLFFGKIKEFTASFGFKNVIDGTNFDDLSAYRPGLKALLELGVISPFAKFEITKAEIREQARLFGLEIFDKPSTPCIATRFPYDTELCLKDIEKVKKGEYFLHSLGFKNCRLRCHLDVARVEIPTEKFADFLDKKTEIAANLKTLGFKYTALDILGLKSGSMDI